MRHELWVVWVVTLALTAAGQEAGMGVAAAMLPDAPSLARSKQATGLIGATNSVNSRQYRDDATCTLSETCYRRLNFVGKFHYFADHSFGPGPFIGALFTAGPEMAIPPAHYPKRWRQGGAAFSRFYGDALAFQAAAETGKFLTGAAFHEDPRYSCSASRNPLLRTMHAVVFTAFDRSDSGHTTLALSNFAGSAAAGFVGNAYLPGGYNDTSHAVARMGIAFGSFALTNLATEFSPELRNMGRDLHLPKFMISRQLEK